MLSTEDEAKITALKALEQEFYNLLNSIDSNRETSLAKTKVEEAIMWALKHFELRG